MPHLSQNQKLALRIKDAVKVSGLGRTFLYEQIKTGKLQAFKVGSCRLILQSELMAFLERHSQASQTLGL